MQQLPHSALHYYTEKVKNGPNEKRIKFAQFERFVIRQEQQFFFFVYAFQQ